MAPTTTASVRAATWERFLWERGVGIVAFGVAFVGGGCTLDEGLEAVIAVPEVTVRPPSLVAIAQLVDVPATRFSPEVAGSLLAHLEAGLGDLEGVIPDVAGVPRAPGFEGRPLFDTELWTLQPSLRVDGAAWLAEIELCGETGSCFSFRAPLDREDPAPGLGDLLHQISDAMGRPPVPGTASAWRSPPSRDTYATLLEGRGAAVYYGLLEPPSAPEGDPRRDPIQRAVLVDPQMAVAGWVLGRRELERERPRIARLVMERAAGRRPQSVVLTAAIARAAEAEGHLREAERRWKEIDAREPGALRFALARARLAVIAGRLQDAEELLDTLPERYQRSSPVLAIRAELLDRRGAAVLDDLLLAWQEASLVDPEPVRRRIMARVKERLYDDALTLTPLLATRGDAAEADRLDLALYLAKRDFDGALPAARRVAPPEVLRRVEAMGERGSLSSLDPEDPEEALVLLGDHLSSGRLDEASKLVDRWARELRLDARYLLLRAEVMEQRGRVRDAEAARREAAWNDPLRVVTTPLVR
jgi:tetratricopeptide (TPR) repeat protein